VWITFVESALAVLVSLFKGEFVLITVVLCLSHQCCHWLLLVLLIFFDWCLKTDTFASFVCTSAKGTLVFFLDVKGVLFFVGFTLNLPFRVTDKRIPRFQCQITYLHFTSGGKRRVMLSLGWLSGCWCSLSLANKACLLPRRKLLSWAKLWLTVVEVIEVVICSGPGKSGFSLRLGVVLCGEMVLTN
jgi:hypothetical protein